MQNELPIKELIIGIVEKDEEILMRKKPEGSLPYKETWYLFGCEKVQGQSDSLTLKNYLESEIGINVRINSNIISPSFEIKTDHDGIQKKFIYTNFQCEYLNGIPKLPKGAERIGWVNKNELQNYDLVPPAVALLKTTGYIK